MSEQNYTSDVDQNDNETTSPGRSTCGPGNFEMPCCGGSDAIESESGCPCGKVMKRHRFAFFAAFSVLTLALLISQVGGVLGIIAFTRTF